MKIYRLDMKVCATAYIKANSSKEARTIARGLKLKSLTIAEPNGRHHQGDVEISGLDFDSPMLPMVSFSPAMTIRGPYSKSMMPEMAFELESVEDEHEA
jgi:hypothetical protein